MESVIYIFFSPDFTLSVERELPAAIEAPRNEFEFMCQLLKYEAVHATINAIAIKKIKKPFVVFKPTECCTCIF